MKQRRRRRQFREIEVIETLVVHQFVPIPCFRCGVPFTADDVRTRNIQKEHLHELELDGPDQPFNCRYSHAAAPCHHTVTNGTKATSAGSSKNRIAKANNENRRAKFRVEKRAPGEAKPQSRWRGRGFDTSRTRHFDGTVTRKQRGN